MAGRNEGALLQMKTADVIDHGIDLILGALQERSKTPLYTEAELRFTNKLIPQMEQASLIFLVQRYLGGSHKVPSETESTGKPGGQFQDGT